MKLHPFVVASALLLAGVVAFCATVVVQHRRSRARRPPPPPELEEAPPAPRRVRPVVEARPARKPPPAPAPAPPAELRVHVAGPHGLVLRAVDVSAHRRGDEDEWTALEAAEDGEVDGGPKERPGTFTAVDLPAGRYDLRVEAPGMRAAQVADVAMGPKVIEIELSRAPLLLGAVGSLGAPGCAGVSVRWSSPEEDGDSGEALVDPDDCTFVAEDLPATGPVTVVASRDAQRETALVTVPISGDPAFLCLAPPCAAAPASVLAYVVDGERREVDGTALTWSLQTDGLEGAMGTSTGAGVVFVHGRRVGQMLLLRAEAGDRAVETTTLVGPGVTEVVLTVPVEAAEDDDDFEITPRGARSIRLVDEGDVDLPSPASAREPSWWLR